MGKNSVTGKLNGQARMQRLELKCPPGSQSPDIAALVVKPDDVLAPYHTFCSSADGYELVLFDELLLANVRHVQAGQTQYKLMPNLPTLGFPQSKEE